MGLATFLNGNTPTRLRGLLWLALSDFAQVGTRTSVSDGGGAATETWTYGPSIPCRLDPLNSNEILSAERISDRSTHLITLPSETEVETNDRVTITGRGTFEITAVQRRTGEMARFLEAVEII